MPMPHSKRHPDLMGQAIKFRAVMEQPIGVPHNSPIQELQRRLVDEEYAEFMYAVDEESQEAQLKELADLVFVCFQYAAARGWELDEACDRVFKSNMSKLVNGVPLRREDGKVLKGPNYHPPPRGDLG